MDEVTESRLKMRFKVGCNNTGYYIAADQGDLESFMSVEIENAEVGDIYTIEAIEMTDEEVAALPEFTGY